ncbi:D-galactose/ D-glucose-binding protein [Rodentibacter pneumotropicus]|uniref:D-galactose/ D-glucose-binding protein n=1 Tax=Rodentibacter pneumotropicus TaxID=758 RepID=A0A448MM13_9PAST|nr:D-galactose/ D-glucose-binding protein [Rodentibacter pneumotropicus]
MSPSLFTSTFQLGVFYEKTAVLSAIALAVGLGSVTASYAANNRIGVTIYNMMTILCH